MQESREYAMGRLAASLACAQTEHAKAMEKLSQNIDTSMFPRDEHIAHSLAEGAGVGYGISNYAGVPNPERGAGKTRVYTVFNASPMPRRELVEITLWDYAGDIDRLQAIDCEGKVVRMQLLDNKPVRYWDHYYIRALIDVEVPLLGYAMYAVCEKEVTDYATFLMSAEREELPNDALTLENERLRAAFDTGSGMLHSLVDKSTGEELLSGPAGLHLVRTENAGMSAWRIGRYLGMEPVADTCRVHILRGVLRNSITFEQKVMHSTAKVTVSLDAGADAVKYSLEVDWYESCSAQPFIPLLTYRLPLKKGGDAILIDLPAGYAVRPACQMDVPALTGACAQTEGITAALITDCKYGYRLADGVLSASLINTAGNPDLYPERGVHAITLFVALTDGSPTALKRKAEALIRPLVGVPTAVHDGALPPRKSLLDFEAQHSVLTSVRMAGDGALAVRLYEAEGREDSITIAAPFAPKRAVLTNLNEEILAEAQIDGERVSFPVAAHHIAQVKIYG